MSQFFESGGQSIGASASTSVLLVNIQTDFIYNMKFIFIITILNVLIIFTYFSSSWINNYFDSKCHRTIKLIEQKFFNAYSIKETKPRFYSVWLLLIGMEFSSVFSGSQSKKGNTHFTQFLVFLSREFCNKEFMI